MNGINVTGADGGQWPTTADAKAWAEAWMKINGLNAMPEDVMLGWFANAIMAGFDAGVRRVPNPFADQAAFMLACGQTVGQEDFKQAEMYIDLVKEEHQEWLDASGKVETLDAVIDQIVVLIGYAHSCGWDVEGAWREVMRSNMAKIDPVTGMVKRREDGKILKPDGWTPPVLDAFVEPRIGTITEAAVASSVEVVSNVQPGEVFSTSQVSDSASFAPSEVIERHPTEPLPENAPEGPAEPAPAADATTSEGTSE